MLFLEILRSSLRALFAKRQRTLLTMLGIIVGVGSVIVMLAYGEGQKAQLLERFSGWSEKLMSIHFSHYSWGGNLTVPRNINITSKDVKAIRNECSMITNTAVQRDIRLEVRYGEISRDNQVVVAVEPDYFEINGNKLKAGRFYTYDENQQNQRVCVIGSEAKNHFFTTYDAVGEYINIAGKRFLIIGEIEEMGSRWVDRRIYIPWLTGHERMEYFPIIDTLNVQIVSPSKLIQAKREVRELLHLRYPAIPVPDDINDDDMSPIAIRSIQSWKQEREQTADSFSLLLKVIGGLSLLIGGVGVMNIMLVSVHERTPEIGLRKSLGARRRDIAAQFIIESVLICSAGGGIGIFFAFLACRYLERMPEEASIPDPIITSWAIAIAIIVTLGTGLFFGIYPAIRAARLSPITALRS